MSKGYWVRPLTGVTAPSVVVSVAAESRPATDRECRSGTPLVLARLCVRTATHRRGKWHPGTAATFDTGSKFHDWLEQYAQPKRTTYVVAPVASNILTLTGFWSRITRAGALWQCAGGDTGTRQAASRRARPYTVRSWVTSGRPDIVRYCRDGRTITWVSGRQFFDLSNTQLATAVGYRRQGERLHDGGVHASTWGVHEVAALWLQAYTSLVDWWRESSGGRWADTVGGLSLSYFRSRLAPRTVLAHRHPAAGRLETAALYGGRASVWYLGRVGVPQVGRDPLVPGTLPRPGPLEEGPVTLVDVRSLYPFLLAAKPFPVRLLGHIDRPAAGAVPDLLSRYGVIASVELNARHPEYPCRRDGRVVFPVGRFSTVLCGPELERAAKSGEIKQVYQLSYYSMGRPFEAAARSLIEMRAAYRRAGNCGWELFVKLLSNSMAGKLAQRRTKWVRRPGVVAEREWGEWSTRGQGDAPAKLYRSMAGLTWEKVAAEDERRLMGQCFAYLTSYGRYYMRTIREHCPPQSIVSQDTDGLWLLPEGLARLRAVGLLSDGSPGTLRVVREEPAGQWWGPKHYWTPGGWTLAGLTAGVEWCGGVEFYDRNQSNPVHRSADRPPDTVYEYARRVVLSTVPVDGTPDQFGWLHPLVLA